MFASVGQFMQTLRKALNILRSNDPLRLAAATAFFTTFALPAILIIFIQLFGLVLDPQILSDHLFEHLALILGRPGAEQVKGALHGFKGLANNWFITIGGFIFLVFVATTLFKVIKDSLNQLWCIKVHPHGGVGFGLRSR